MNPMKIFCKKKPFQSPCLCHMQKLEYIIAKYWTKFMDQHRKFRVLFTAIFRDIAFANTPQEISDCEPLLKGKIQSRIYHVDHACMTTDMMYLRLLKCFLTELL